MNNYWEHFVELGEGDIDFLRILQILENIGFNGWAMVELDNIRTTPLHSTKKSREYLKGIGY